jgi:hypothetical protein
MSGAFFHTKKEATQERVNECSSNTALHGPTSEIDLWIAARHTVQMEHKMSF